MVVALAIAMAKVCETPRYRGQTRYKVIKLLQLAQRITGDDTFASLARVCDIAGVASINASHVAIIGVLGNTIAKTDQSHVR